jgi:hypothetical protein
MAASIRFGTQELESGVISPKMVEQQLEGDNVADLMSSQSCGQGPTLDSASSFNFCSFSSLLVFFSNGGYSDFCSCPLWGWKGGLSSPFPSCAISKMILDHNPKGWCALASA